ncbi:ATP-dependent Clp protease adapter ClpS [Salinispira pacifica]|uniref:ATP-dependent Clp protease adapter protein ClpS n=1 Tax=Salinispira pacifica TaxID=1307761 RepID=V5WG65_9SPIO|nr:ATP-dependent Clp protease adapter ClpS [Salinispira pacifica]AHC14788.1 ATP-dependent Clp protease adaptor protein ClpS [Salinispira pacifica]
MPEPGGQGDVQLKKKTDLKKPDMYKVIMLNDDYTTMEFVVEVLMKFFQKDPVNAQRIMFEIHEKGAGDVGTFTYDIAQSKVQKVHRYAREKEFPLRCRIEKA